MKKLVVKTVVALVAVGVVSGALIAPVLAGEYVFDRLESEGGIAYSSTANPNTQDWPSNSYLSASASYSGSTSYSISTSTEGRLRAVFKWQPYAQGDVPGQDSVLKVKIFSQMQLGTNGQSPLQISEKVLDNGFGDPAVLYSPGYNYWISQGYHLVQVKTNGQTEVKTPFVFLKGKVKLDGSTWGNIGVYPSFSAQKDTRSLKLTRGGARGETYDPDGTTRGDTIFSHHRKEGTGSNSAIAVTYWNAETFLSNFEGNWNTPENPIVDYSWSPVENPLGPFQVSKDSAKWDMNAGNRFTYSFWAPFTQVSWHGSATPPLTKTYTYTATDSQGVTGTAKYILTLHDQYEVKTHTVTPVHENPRRASSDMLGPCQAQASQAVELSVQLTASPGGAVGEFIASALGVDLSATASYTESTTTSVGDDVPAGKYTWMEQLDKYYYHTGLADHYDEAGYLAEVFYTIRQVPPDKKDQYGFRLHLPFEDINGGPPPGP